MLQGKHIVVGISGGIAAYKIPDLIRRLRKEGAEVKVTTTRNALEFVTELTLQTLSGNKVYSDVFAAINEHSTEHISLPDWADLMVIAPATANVLGKMAHGIADDALTTTFCAMLKPVVIAPAMNDKMYANPAVRDAAETLTRRKHITMLDCAEGELACGTTGKGRMQETDAILEAIRYALTPKDLTGKNVLVTAGPTQEAIDPVRYISNRSSGKMGNALVLECWRRGANVRYICGPIQNMPIVAEFYKKDAAGYVATSVTSAQEMAEAVFAAADKAHLIILCAAVADFTPLHTADEKIKKVAGQTTQTVELTLTTDIAAALGQNKPEGQILAGFALETTNEQTNAQHKLVSKNLDYIVLNSLRDAGAGFGTDTNKVTVYSRSGAKKDVPLLSKENVAREIIDFISL